MTTPSVAALVHESLGERVYKSLRDHILSRATAPEIVLLQQKLVYLRLPFIRKRQWELSIRGFRSSANETLVIIPHYATDTYKIAG